MPSLTSRPWGGKILGSRKLTEGLGNRSDLSCIIDSGTRGPHASLCAASDGFSAEADETHAVSTFADELEDADRGSDGNADHALAESGHRYRDPTAMITLQNEPLEWENSPNTRIVEEDGFHDILMKVQGLPYHVAMQVYDVQIWRVSPV